MSDSLEDSYHLSQKELLFINRICDQFESQWQSWSDDPARNDASKPKAETWLAKVPDRLKVNVLRELIPIEIEYLSSVGDTIRTKDYTTRFPEIDDGWLMGLLQESLPESPSLRENETIDAAVGDTDDDSFDASFADDVLPKRIGQYEIVGVLGSGGMGTVYQAIHREMQREVALKMVRSDLSRQEAIRKRFQREVIAAARLSHPNIVTAYDAGEHDGQPFLVSEWIDGVDLRRLVRQQGPLSVDQAIKFTKDAAHGLQYAHRHEIIHRDIKPANLLVDQADTVKILDLGLARLTIDSEATRGFEDVTAELTDTGAVMGTASYMAPEQARSTRRADARSDIYSLGCVLYFLLTGRAPYKGESVVDTLLAHATEPIPDLETNSIPSEVKTLVQQMMAKSPDERPQSMSEVIARLESLQMPTKPDVTTRDKRDPGKTRKPRSRQQQQSGLGSKIYLGAAISVLGLLGFSAWYAFFHDTGSTTPDALDSGSGALVYSVNRALEFDGQNSYVEVPTVNRGPGDAVTIEIIARVDGPGTANPVSWLGENWMALFHSNQWGIGRKQGGRSLFSIAHNDSADQLGRWRHIVGSWDGSRLHLFLDGQYVRQGPMEYELLDTLPGMFIGGADPNRLPGGQNQRFFHGAIDAVRIVDRVVYPAGESFSPPSELKLVPDTYLLLQFNDRPGSKMAKDESNNSHTAVIHDANSIEME